MSNTSVDWIEVSDVVPEQKDHDRAEGMKFRKGTFHGDNSPFKSNASKMAKAIEDPIKLVRRAKAVVQMYGTGPYFSESAPPCLCHNYTKQWRDEKYAWEPFADRLFEMGFSREQVEQVAGIR